MLCQGVRYGSIQSTNILILPSHSILPFARTIIPQRNCSARIIIPALFCPHIHCARTINYSAPTVIMRAQSCYALEHPEIESDLFDLTGAGVHKL